jgi:hypothetical protein
MMLKASDIWLAGIILILCANTVSGQIFGIVIGLASPLYWIYLEKQ